MNEQLSDVVNEANCEWFEVMIGVWLLYEFESIIDINYDGDMKLWLIGNLIVYRCISMRTYYLKVLVKSNKDEIERKWRWGINE